MTNGEMYADALSRLTAFRKSWKVSGGGSSIEDFASWLDMPAEGEVVLLPCPFCKSEVVVKHHGVKCHGHYVQCPKCLYTSRDCKSKMQSIVSHNMIANAVFSWEKAEKQS